MKSVTGRTEKRCPRCQVVKPVSAFHRRSDRGDGYNDTCKECRREMQQDWTEEQREAARESVRRSQARPESRRRAVAYMAEYQKRPEVKAKHRARNAVKASLLKGTLVKPTSCSRCKRPKHRRAIHAHHEDYTKPLNVQWLCVTCHGKAHGHQIAPYFSQTA